MRPTAVGVAAVLAAVAGCLDDRGPAGLTAEPARWGLAAQLTSPPQSGDAMRVRLTYARGTAMEGELATVVVPIPVDAAPGSSFSRPLVVDLAPCLADPRHTPEGAACSVTARVVLTRGGVTLDEIVLGPFLLEPGQTSAPQQVTLHEVDRIEVTVPDVGPLYPGDTRALDGRVLDRDGRVVDDRAITWSSTSPDVAMVDATSGVLTAVAPGTTVVRAASGGRTTEVTVRVRARPQIRLAPDAVGFEVEQGQALPPAAGVAVTNGVEGKLAGLALGDVDYAQAEGGWLAASLAGAEAPTTLTLRPTRSDLPPGSYVALVPLSATDAADAPASVRVTYTVHPPAALALAPTSLAFASDGTLPPAQRVAVATGDAALGPVTATVVYGNATAGWLDVSVDGAGATPTTLTVRPNTTTLPGGGYTADVVVSVAGARNSPAVVQVEYTVPPVTVSAAPAGLTFIASYESGLPAAQDVSVATSRSWSGAAVVAGIAYGSAASGWLSATVTGSGLPTTLTVQPTLTDLPPGRYDATLRATVPGTGDTTSVPVAFYAGYGLYAYATGSFLYGPADTVALFADLMASDESGELRGQPVTWRSLSPYLKLLATTSRTGPDDSVRVTLGDTYTMGAAQVEARAGGLVDTLDLFIDGATFRRGRPSGPTSAPIVRPTLRRAPPLERPRRSPSTPEQP
ncbi:MAG TPA: hypothetical protein VFS08_16970 [Gemmatimonadaceae bacterium]|nr:hypothetical protein [Gemmatimonadaceae bacterium]